MPSPVTRTTRFLIDWFLLDSTPVYILSYPKSGRTWLRALIGRALCEHYDLPESLLIDTPALTRKAGLPVTRFSHDRTHLMVGLPDRWLPTARAGYSQRKVLLLLRDPRDLMVSCFFQATKRINVFDGPIDDLVRSKRYGIHKYVTWVENWYANRDRPRAFETLTYEAMHADPYAALRQTLAFIGASDIADTTIDNAVEYASFSNLRKMEQSGQITDHALKPGDVQDEQSFKTRQGKVGGYAEHLTPATVQFIDEVVAASASPWLTAYLDQADA